MGSTAGCGLGSRDVGEGGVGVDLSYIHLPAGAEPPQLDPAHGPFRAVVVISQTVTDAWRSRVSDWLVASGCLYMMAWGPDCSRWDDAVDWANLEAFDYGDIPDRALVMTTWHENESLAETFWFAGHCAVHSDVELRRTIIVHVAPHDRQGQVLRAYREAQEAED